MSFEWKEEKLKNLCLKIGSGATPRGGKESYISSGIPFIRSQNVYNHYFSYDGLAFIDDVQAKKLESVTVLQDDILLNITGDSVCRSTLVPRELVPARVNQHVAIIRTDKSKLNPFFLKSYLVSRDMQTYMLSLAQTGGTRAALTKGMIEDFMVPLPNIKDQELIVQVLQRLDEKIEINNAINKNLEEMAQTLFKRWFIDFEFPNENGEPYKSSGGEFEESELGLIPKGWKVSNIGQYSKVRSGYAFKSSWWREKGIKVIKIKNITGNSINLDGVDYVDYEKAENASNFIARPGDILIAMTGATVGKIGLVPMLNECLLVNQRVGKFFLGEKPFERNGYLFSLLTSKEIYDRIVSEASGSAQPNISPTDIENIKIKTPFSSLIDKFNEITGSMLKTISGNIYEINQLSNLRDSLLPKLMSGEIRVPIDEQEQVSNN
ncbi:restriction endonuclease subunit S [Paenibacillus xylanilyticus]|uniref:restriction endonuclease subunit S n=1 Tax=Paenibacillus xylanilyticus TaxID=248903 RepID=UPI003AAF3FBA